MHGVEVCHSPYVMATGTDSDLFPPLPKMPCCVENCERCAAHFRGSSSPGSGFATAEASCCRQMWLPTKLRTILQASGEDGPAVVGGGLHQLYDSSRLGATGALCPGAQRVMLELGMGELFDQWRTCLACIGSQGILANFVEPRSYPRAPRGRPWAA